MGGGTNGDIEEKKLLRNLLEQLQFMLLDAYDEKMSFLYSESPVTLPFLNEQLQVSRAMLHSWMMKSKPILVEMEEILEETSWERSPKQEEMLQIDRMLRDKEYAALKVIFESLYISIKKTTEAGMENTRTYYNALGIMADYIERNIHMEELPEGLQKGYYHLRYMTGIDEIQNYLVRLLEYLSQNASGEADEEHQLIARLENYVMEHITEDLTLGVLARQVHFNPSYLSRFYKNETGRNLSTFIKEARIEKARELLRNTDKKVGDIAKLLGFDSVSYFNVFFKKTVGVTPGEYRMELQK